jgi:hypothetical protein
LDIFVRGGSTKAAGTMTSSVGGKTVSKVTHQDFGSLSRLYHFAMDQGADAVSQTLTFDCTGDPAASVVILVYETPGIANYGVAGCRQFAGDGGSSGVAPAPVFPAVALTGNPTLGFVAQAVVATITEPTGWTEDYDTDPNQAETVHRDSGFTGDTITWGSNASGTWAALIAEIDAGVSAPTRWLWAA